MKEIFKKIGIGLGILGIAIVGGLASGIINTDNGLAVGGYQPFIQDAKSSFGELLVVEPTSIVQLKFSEGINSRLTKTRANDTGSISSSDSLVILQTGTNSTSRAQLLSRIPVRYNPGQGGSVKFTAIFNTCTAGSTQVVGVGDISDGYFFGCDGTEFGVLRRRGGQPEIQTNSITIGAVTSTGNITITLDDATKTVAVVSGDSAREVAVKIADTDFSDTGTGWDADVDNNTIIFRAYDAGDRVGNFSLVDTDTTGVVGTFATTTDGVTATDTWVSQTNWTEDKADGSDQMDDLIETNGNVYSIRYQWLGFGPIIWSIYSPNTDSFIDVHREDYANANTVPSIADPTLPLCADIVNGANTTNLTLKVGSMGGFTDGRIERGGFHNSTSTSLTNIGMTEVPLFTIKNKLVFNDVTNRIGVLLGFLDLQTDATKPITFRLRTNATLTGPVNFSDVITATSIVSVDIGATGVLGGNIIETLVLGKVDSKHIDLHILDGKALPGDTVTLTAQANSGANHEATVSLTWAELF